MMRPEDLPNAPRVSDFPKYVDQLIKDLQNSPVELSIGAPWIFSENLMLQAIRWGDEMRQNKTRLNLNWQDITDYVAGFVLPLQCLQAGLIVSSVGETDDQYKKYLEWLDQQKFKRAAHMIQALVGEWPANLKVDRTGFFLVRNVAELQIAHAHDTTEYLAKGLILCLEVYRPFSENFSEILRK